MLHAPACIKVHVHMSMRVVAPTQPVMSQSTGPDVLEAPSSHAAQITLKRNDEVPCWLGEQEILLREWCGL